MITWMWDMDTNMENVAHYSLQSLWAKSTGVALAAAHYMVSGTDFPCVGGVISKWGKPCGYSFLRLFYSCSLLCHRHRQLRRLRAQK